MSNPTHAARENYKAPPHSFESTRGPPKIRKRNLFPRIPSHRSSPFSAIYYASGTDGSTVCNDEHILCKAPPFEVVGSGCDTVPVWDRLPGIWPDIQSPDPIFQAYNKSTRHTILVRDASALNRSPVRYTRRPHRSLHEWPKTSPSQRRVHHSHSLH